MAVSDYRDKRFLIIDSLKPSRDLLKQFAFNLQPDVVEASGYSNDIITRCSENHYDVLLLGYDLGDSRKNGQQLLEELRVNNLVNRQSVVILITAENTQAMVLAALEHKPDDYLTKPYRIKDLLTRLDRCYMKKRDMGDIYQALDDKDPEKAIALCDRAIELKTPYQAECYGIKSRQLFALDEFDQAAKIYRRFETEKNCQWATIGLGKIALHQEHYNDAISYFSGLVEKSPLYLSSYDWLATSYEIIEQFQRAQDVLEKAVTLSPLSVKRVERYAKLCFENGNYEKATNAFDQNYQIASNSIHHKPENAFNFSESLNKLAHELSDYQFKIKKNRVVNALSETNKNFNQLGVKLQSQLHTVRLMQKNKEEYDAKRMLKSAENLIEKVGDDLDNTSLVGIAKLLGHLDRQALASQLITKVVERAPDDITLLNDVESITDTNVKLTERKETQQALNQAAKSYTNKDFISAYKRLNEAYQRYPHHIGIKLNLVQTLLAIYIESKKQESLVKAGKLLSSIAGLSRDNPAFPRFSRLNSEFKNLNNK